MSSPPNSLDKASSPLAAPSEPLSVGRLAHSTERLSPHSERAKSLETHHVMPNPQDALLPSQELTCRIEGKEFWLRPKMKRLNESEALPFVLTERGEVGSLSLSLWCSRVNYGRFSSGSRRQARQLSYYPQP